MTTYFVKKRHQYSHLCEGEKLCKKTQGAKVEKSGAERPQAGIPYKYADPVGGRDPHNLYTSSYIPPRLSVAGGKRLFSYFLCP